MTLSHAASVLTAVWTVACGVLFVATGSLTWGALLLAAPLPMKLVRLSEWETWSLGEVVRQRRDDHTVSDALDDALRGPLPVRPVEDGAFFVPDCPALPAVDAPAPVPPTAPASTPLR